MHARPSISHSALTPTAIGEAPTHANRARTGPASTKITGDYHLRFDFASALMKTLHP